MNDLWLRTRDRAYFNIGKFYPSRSRGYDSQVRVSIILPTFNRLNYLRTRSIPSVLCQTERSFELIVVAHGCTDGTAEHVRSLAQADSRVRLIECDRDPVNLGYPPTAENHWLVGPVRPINVGLRQATGYWIARIDDDDEWTKDHLEVLLTLAESARADFVSAAYEVSDARGNWVVNPTGKPPIGGVQTWLYKRELNFVRANINSWRKSWNRNNDTDMEERFRRLKIRIASADTIVARIRPRENERFVGSKAYLDDSNKIKAIYG